MASMEFKNNARSTVADNPLAQAATTLNVATGEGANFPSSFPFKLTIFDDSSYPDVGLEIVKCTARTTDALTIVRAQEGTADVEHANGERVAMLITAGHLTDIVTKLDGIEDSAKDDQTASEVPIVDSGSIITATDVENALQENRTAIDLNTAKDTNITTNLSEGTNTETTVDVNSSDGSNATLVSASALRAGLLTKAKFDEIVANNAKVTNAAHTGDVTGSGALTIDKTAISGKAAVTAVDTDYVLIGDTSDTNNLKKALVSSLSSTTSPQMIVAASDSDQTTGADYVCDGTNDEVQILAAITALPATGGEVLLLDGTFNIQTNSVIITKSNISIRGSGRSTVLNSSSKDVIIVGNDSTSVSGFNISNLKITITGLYHAIKLFKNVTHSEVSYVYINGGYHGVFLDSGGNNYIKISNCTMFSMAGAGIEIDSPVSKYVTIDNCFVEGAMAEGMYFSAAENVTINGCHIRNGPNWGIQFTNGCKYCSVIGNNITTDVHGIAFGGVSGTVVHCIASNNVIYNCGHNGIDLDYADDCTISGNSILASSQTTDDTYFGIEMDHGNNNNIFGNTVRKGAETNKSAHGVNITANATLTVLHGNDLFESGDTAAIADAGTNTRKWDNILNSGVTSTHSIARKYLNAKDAELGTTNNATLVNQPGNGVYPTISYLTFNDSSPQYAYWHVPMEDYDGGTISVTIYTKIAATPSGAVTLKYALQSIGIANSEPMDAASIVSTGDTVTFNLNTTELLTDLMIQTGSCDPANVAANDFMIFGVERDTTNDTLTGNAELVGILLEYNRL